MTLDERRLLVRDRAEKAARLVRESWDEITALESIVPQDLPFDVHAYVNMLATESDDCRIPEEAVDELLGLSAEEGSKAVNTHEAHKLRLREGHNGAGAKSFRAGVRAVQTPALPTV